MLSSLQSDIQKLIDTATRDGRERGMQVAVYRNGELIVDAVAGYTAADETVMVTPETVFPVFSVSKGVTTTIIHRLIQQGFFEMDQSMASIWPEFGAHGKDAITIRQVLNHTAGLARLPADLTPEQAADWSWMCQLMERSTPRHTPGAEVEYHALSMGWLLGGLAERATGKKFAELLANEICEPLGLKSLYFGFPPTAKNPVAVLENSDLGAAPDSTTPQAVPILLWPLSDFMNKPVAQRACVPSGNGLMAARDVARFYAATLPVGVDGIELLTETQRTAALDTPDGMLPGKWINGYARMDDLEGGPTRFYGHNGFGGSKGGAHLDFGLAYGITHNAFGPTAITDDLLALILKEIQI